MEKLSLYSLYFDQSPKKTRHVVDKIQILKMNREPEQREDPLLEADPSHLLALLNYLRPRCLRYSDLYNLLAAVTNICMKPVRLADASPEPTTGTGTVYLRGFLPTYLAGCFKLGKARIAT